MLGRKPAFESQAFSDQMNKWVDEWLLSGQKQIVFCKSKGITRKSFSYWLKKRRRETSANGGFVPVLPPTEQREDRSAVFVRVRTASGIEISFEQGVSSEYLRSLLGW